jgi:tight adherence protein B
VSALADVLEEGAPAVAGVSGAMGLEAVAVCAAMVCAGTAAWLLAGRDDGARRAGLLLAGGNRAAGGAGPRLPPRWAELAQAVRGRVAGPGRQAWWCLPAGVVLALVAQSWLPCAAGAAGVPVVRRLLRRREERSAEERRAAAVLELCAAVAGELHAGRQPDRALLAAGAVALRDLGDGGAAVLAAARFGGDVPGALREAAHAPGAEGLSGVAACWQVAVEGGAGLARGLDAVAGALRAELDQREELRALLAGPRSTALVLALLPAFGLLLGGAMGADPLHVLLHSPAGLVCLAAGALLEWAGLAWVARLVSTAAETTPVGKAGRAAPPEKEGTV